MKNYQTVGFSDKYDIPIFGWNALNYIRPGIIDNLCFEVVRGLKDKEDETLGIVLLTPEYHGHSTGYNKIICTFDMIFEGNSITDFYNVLIGYDYDSYVKDDKPFENSYYELKLYNFPTIDDCLSRFFAVCI